MNIEEFKKHLSKHDWYYQYSDDHRWWSSGNASWKIINDVLKDNKDDPEFDKAFKQACPWENK
jgi:hypothetical protein